MAEQFFNIPREIYRYGLEAEMDNTLGHQEIGLLQELTPRVRNLVVQLGSVMVKTTSPFEGLYARMVVKQRESPTLRFINIPIFPSGQMKPDGSGFFVGTVQGPIPVKAGEGEFFYFELHWDKKPATSEKSVFWGSVWGFYQNVSLWTSLGNLFR
jgi:hypothetical protein